MQEVLLDAELRIAALQVAGDMAVDALVQRVCLHEAEALEGLRERRRREQAARDRVAPQLMQGERHVAIMQMRRQRA
ncbi:hypothetical protein [Piscinibacter sp.]|uniref:hypothetical protein n=1 Tax=Piscinibacter sp. TaxID=1903157 RepID=UPI00391F6EE2